jgi:hypothetical protein
VFWAFPLFKGGQECPKANTENAGENLRAAQGWLKAIGFAAMLVWQADCCENG